MASKDSGYVCTLDEKSLKRAKEELNEDPKNRLGAVETFRKWILEQKHIKCPTDTAFLLCFLRVRYFSQLEARELLERYILRRVKIPKWYMNLDPCDPKTLAAIDSGYILVLPERDDEGRKICVVKAGLLEFSGKPFSKIDVLRTIVCLFDYIYLLDEKTCVNGTVTFIDISHYSLKVHSAITMEDRKEFAETWQNNFPARLKLLLLYNGGAMIDMFFAMLKMIFSEKLQKRMKNCGNVLENVYKDIPMRCLPVEYLPDDYKGPNAGTEKQIIESMKRDLTRPEVRARLQYLSSEQWKVDGAQKSRNDIPQASFRKLNID